MKCLIQIYINFTSEFDRGHGPLSLLPNTFFQIQNAPKSMVAGWLGLCRRPHWRSLQHSTNHLARFREKILQKIDTNSTKKTRKNKVKREEGGKYGKLAQQRTLKIHQVFNNRNCTFNSSSKMISSSSSSSSSKPWRRGKLQTGCYDCSPSACSSLSWDSPADWRSASWCWSSDAPTTAHPVTAGR